MSSNKLITPALRFSEIKDGDLENYSRGKIEKLTGNPNYPSPFTELDQMLAALNAYVPALAKAKNGHPADTEDKNAKRQILENTLRSLALRCSQIADGNMVIYLTSGFEARKEREPGGLLSQVQNVMASDGPEEQSILLEWNHLDGAKAYVVEMTETPQDDATWKMVHAKYGGVITRTQTVVTELVSGKKHWFRVAGVNSFGIGEFSEPAMRIPQ